MSNRTLGVVTFAVLAVTACDKVDDGPLIEAPAAVLRFSAEAPLSVAGDIVLLPAEMACGIDSYETRIYCVTPAGDLHTFGAEGEGPGEFSWITHVMRGADGGLGVLDGGLNRLSIFEPVAGALVSETPLPGRFSTQSHIASTLRGRYREPGTGSLEAEVDVHTGLVLWQRLFSEDILECGIQSSGVPTNENGLLFVACHGEYLIWFADRDADEPTAIIPVPTYVSRFPNRDDVALYARRTWGRPPSESEIEQYRTTPKHWYGKRRLDERGRLWAISAWEAGDAVPDSSYLDVYEVGPSAITYRRTIQVRHKVVGFDVLGETLVVLVDRPVTSADLAGIPKRGIDWYTIGEIGAEEAGGGVRG